MAEALRPRRLVRLARQARLDALGGGLALTMQRAHQARRPLRRAHRGAEIHHRLGEVARPLRRRQHGGKTLQLALGGRQRCLDREQPRHHPLDIAVDRRDLRPVGDRRHRRRRIGTDARQRRQHRLVVGKSAAVHRSHRLRALVQISRAAVVAEPGPGDEHIVDAGARKRLDRRPAPQELEVVGNDRLDHGLLQHDLAEPHPVGIGLLSRWISPGQIAALAVVPFEKRHGHARFRARHTFRRELLAGHSCHGCPFASARIAWRDGRVLFDRLELVAEILL